MVEVDSGLLTSKQKWPGQAGFHKVLACVNTDCFSGWLTRPADFPRMGVHENMRNQLLIHMAVLPCRLSLPIMLIPHCLFCRLPSINLRYAATTSSRTSRSSSLRLRLPAAPHPTCAAVRGHLRPQSPAPPCRPPPSDLRWAEWRAGAILPAGGTA